MTSYVAGLLGIVLLGVIIELLLPDGQMNKFIKGIYSLYVIFVLISPITAFISSGFTFSGFFTSIEFVIDTDYLNSIYISTDLELTTYLLESLYDEGISGVEIEISHITDEFSYTINEIVVNIKNLSIITDEPHINRYTVIIDAIKKYLYVEEEQILFNE